ncbi:MAG: sigma-54-dependent transcriptional regulator [Bacteroidota bacterium]
MYSILYIDDEENNLKVFQSLFKRHYEVYTASSADEGLSILSNYEIHLVITDQRMPGKTGVEFLEEIVHEFPDVIRIVLTGFSDLSSVVEAINKGKVYHYLTKPWKQEELKIAIDNGLENYRLKKENKKLIIDLQKKNEHLQEANTEIKKLKNRLEAENTYLQEEIKREHDFNNLIGTNSQFKAILNRVEQVAATNATVLIQGETGSGKELIARAIHSLSSRSNRTLVKVNCATLPANLIESELFGHEKGAFTGAINKKTGLFELAHEATIFLDEIGELPLELQAKLLRVLQEGEFTRLGGSKTLQTNVRVIAATNRDLEEAIENNEFRSDLYYRLNVFPIDLPPLRNRKDDIPILVRHFVQKYEKKIGRKISKISNEAMNFLQKYHWPGNIRELENVIERSLILSIKGDLELDDWIRSVAGKQQKKNDTVNSLLTMEEAERSHIIQTLELSGWKIAGKNSASEKLNLKPSTLRSRMQKLGIRRVE